jgi:hypothetical protein
MSSPKVAVFLGPTLPVEDAAALLKAEFFPPARQGDLYRTVLATDCEVVALIDGYFHQVPAVWHKEILWALSRGVHVSGAASMGALRATELAAFGMRGVGQIFESYRVGQFVDKNGRTHAEEVFENDDEVALLHGPSASHYLNLSEPLVNFRATFAAAVAAGQMPAVAAAAGIAAAKALRYGERTWAKVLGEMQIRAPQVHASAAAWLLSNRQNLKAADARELLQSIAKQTQWQALPANFEFAHTHAWERMVRAQAEVHKPPRQHGQWEDVDV